MIRKITYRLEGMCPAQSWKDKNHIDHGPSTATYHWVDTSPAKSWDDKMHADMMSCDDLADTVRAKRRTDKFSARDLTDEISARDLTDEIYARDLTDEISAEDWKDAMLTRNGKRNDARLVAWSYLVKMRCPTGGLVVFAPFVRFRPENLKDQSRLPCARCKWESNVRLRVYSERRLFQCLETSCVLLLGGPDRRSSDAEVIFLCLAPIKDQQLSLDCL